ncbi:hypothetical protein BJS_00438 [Bradyrhizobium japonicum SEMIA 5079]|nr:hypothetical protein BJS_00438 [Bradyrhizobium japonicum SEMIA 5079]
MEPGPIAGHLFDVVVNGLHKLLVIRAVVLSAEDEVVAKPGQLGQVGRYRLGSHFFLALTHALLVPRSCRRSVLCLGHDAIETRRDQESNYRLLVARNARELLRVVGVEKQRAAGSRWRASRKRMSPTLRPRNVTFWSRLIAGRCYTPHKLLLLAAPSG